MKRLLMKRIDDATTEAVSRSHAEAIVELQSMPAMQMRVIAKSLVLQPNTDVFIPHQLGRAPRFVWVSPPLGTAVISTAGVVRELRNVSNAGVPVDASQVICLRSTIFVDPITVDVAVF